MRERTARVIRSSTFNGCLSAAVLCSALACAAIARAEAVPVTAPVTAPVTTSERPRSGWAALPVATYSPETSLGLGAFATHFFRFGAEP